MVHDARALVVVAMAITAAGCDSDGERCADPFAADCEGTTCAQPHELGLAPLIASVDTCPLMANAVDLAGCPSMAAGGRTAVVRLAVPVAGDYEICTTAPVGTAVQLSSACDRAPTPAACLSDRGGCVTTALADPEIYLFVEEPDGGDCGPLDLAIRALADDSAEVNCLDGVDDDGDGFVDCEDRGCQLEFSCSTQRSPPEQCNRRDDGAAPPFADFTIDELACRCATDDGCDDLATGSPQEYVCHPGGAAQDGSCGPRCDVGVDWCAFSGNGVCDAEGRCQDSGARRSVQSLR